ncbi:MAG: hypothetical protein KJ550_10070 [Proteobacteria bacterium]|nr:hypothetical protein [Pseudomonadota bacterium]MBU4013800.1 hypothetical protein [Pseudomonadota bacterium]MBU4067120.1 hypothetical protein [Pseudomonadota bacterium]MBU4102134.1 hypothetical protein [Pseudomonadota bacterium]MBU4127073.1 hypothetical protein [Pseudomonadota bacterium]
MTEIGKERILKIVQADIKDPIKIVLKNKNYRSAVMLILTGIDTMAYLSTPANKKNQDCYDFIEWVDKYVLFEGREKLTGLELYIARCVILHSYSDYSSIMSMGDCRKIEYTDQSNPDAIGYNPEESDKTVKVSVYALSDAFFKGLDRFFEYLFSNNEKVLLVEKRLDELMLKFPTV